MKHFSSGGVTCVSRDEDGVVWMGGTGVVYAFRGDDRVRYELPSSFKSFGISAVFKDHDGVLWLDVDPEGIFQLRNGEWQRYDRQSELPKASSIVSYVDPSDRKWFGYAGDMVAAIDGETIRMYSRDDGLRVGDVEVIQGRSRRIWVGGTIGLAVLDGDRFRTLVSDGDDVFVGISGIVETAGGETWRASLERSSRQQTGAFARQRTVSALTLTVGTRRNSVSRSAGIDCFKIEIDVTHFFPFACSVLPPALAYRVKWRVESDPDPIAIAALSAKLLFLKH